MYGSVDFFDIKGVCEALFDALNIKDAEYTAVTDNPTYHPGRCADITVNGNKIGTIGELQPSVGRNFGIDVPCYVGELKLDELIKAAAGMENRESDYCRVGIEHKITLGEIADLLYSFKESRINKLIPDMSENSFYKKLYSTYLTYLDAENFSYKLKMNCDNRGSFTEILRTLNAGQISVNISKPGITKGQHWHNTKNEKFVVVSGRGLIQLRQIGTDKIVNYEVSGEEITVVDMIPGYTHNIINLSDTEDLVAIMWCNECFDPNRPDTYFEEV